MDKICMKLRFPTNDTGETEGLSDAGIETFKENAYSSAARESAQNSRDAAELFPVRVTYDVILLKPSEIPDFDALKAAIKACIASNAALGDLKTDQFFARALQTLELEEIPALRISDFGTRGLLGPCVPGTPFHTLVKSSGVTNKSDPTSGGSYGIGKRAAFAISNLHTVFYSTLYPAEGAAKFLAQGKCTLTSHCSDGRERRATGYWGSEGYLPISTLEEAPTWLRRDEVGTTTISLGFDASDGWQFRIAESLARNFVGAIDSQQLEFSVDEGAILLRKNNISVQLHSKELQDSAIQNNSLSELDLARQVHECLTSSKSDRLEKEFPAVGRMKLHVLVGDGRPQRVAILRNGMFVADNLSAFGEKFSNFPSYKEFVAVLEPADSTASSTLKRLENPAHNSLSSDRIVDLAERAKIKKEMELVGRWVRGEIRRLAYQPVKSAAPIDELNEFFGEPGIAEDIVDRSDETTPGRIVFRAKKPPAEQSNPDYSLGDEEESDGGGAPGASEGTGRGPDGSGSGKGLGNGGSTGESVAFQELRAMPDPTDIEYGRILIFTPNSSGRAKISFIAKGMNNDSVISDATLIDNSDAEGYVELTAGKRTSIRIRFDEPYSGPINIAMRMAKEKDSAK